MNKRITPEHVLKAYEQTGLTPKQGGYFDSEEVCGCGMGVLFALAHMTAFDMTLEELYEMQDNEFYEEKFSRFFDRVYGIAYRAGFTQGFDHMPDKQYDRFKNHPRQMERFEEGWEDGWAAWNAVKHLAKENNDEKNNS